MIHSSTYQDLVERSEARGEMRGLRLGRVEFLKELLTHRLGPLPESVSTAIIEMDLPSLLRLGIAMSDFNSIEELTAWIERQKQLSTNGAA